AHRSCGIDDHHGKTLAGEIQRNLLGLKLGALVGAAHFFERDVLRFIADAAGRDADAADGAGVNYALNSGGARRMEQRTRTLYVRAEHVLRITSPQTIISGHVENYAASSNSFP